MNFNHMLEHLLYMNIGNPSFDYSNQHVFAMKSGSQLPICNRVYGNDLTDTNDILKIKYFMPRYHLDGLCTIKIMR